jgi:hypothetical protein
MGNEFGYINGDWRAQPMQLGYSAVYNQFLSGALVAGANVIDGTTVPTGEVWIVTAMVGVEGITAPAAIYFSVVSQAIETFIFSVLAPVAGVFYIWNGYQVLGPGDNMRFRTVGSTAGDNYDIRIHGFKIHINK